MITSELFEDDISSESYFTRLLWIGIITAVADDQGRMLDNPAIMRAKIFPLDNEVTDQQILESLKKIGKSIYRYTSIDGKKLIQIVKWWEYQTPSWAAPSRFLPPDNWIDRVKVHVVGNKVRTDNWDVIGGFLHNKLPTRQDSAIDDVKSESDIKIESDVESEAPPLLYPNLSEYEFQNADNILIDDIFLQVTGFLPSKEKDNIRKTIVLIADRENIQINPKNKPKVADILRPYFLEMCRRKNKNGQPYSRNGLFWLLEWAMVGEIPPIYEAKTKTESIADNNAKILQDAIDKYEAENG